MEENAKLYSPTETDNHHQHSPTSPKPNQKRTERERLSVARKPSIPANAWMKENAGYLHANAKVMSKSN